jgi:hypothetical protein
LPYIFNRIEFWRIRRQGQQRYVRRDDQAFGRPMPPGAINLHQTVRARCHITADFAKVLAHGFEIDRRHDNSRTHAARWANGTEHIGPGIAAIAWCSRSAAALGPNPGQRALLTHSGFILPPDFERFASGMGRQSGSDQVGEVFLCVSWATASCSGWNGRAVSLRKASLANNLPTLRS